MTTYLRRRLLGALSVCSALAISLAGVTPAAGAHAHHHRPHHHRPHHHRTIPQRNGGDHDADNNGGPSDGDGNI